MKRRAPLIRPLRSHLLQPGEKDRWWQRFGRNLPALDWVRVRRTLTASGVHVEAQGTSNPPFAPSPSRGEGERVAVLERTLNPAHRAP